jgi:hypothetical protein
MSGPSSTGRSRARDFVELAALVGFSELLAISFTAAAFALLAIGLGAAP